MEFLAAVALSARAAAAQRVEDAERAIVAAEGSAHVTGRYFADPPDAGRQRRWAAERMVAEAERREEWLARQLDGVTVTDGADLVRSAIRIVAQARRQRLAPEQVRQVVATVRVLWHAAQASAEGATHTGRAA